MTRLMYHRTLYKETMILQKISTVKAGNFPKSHLLGEEPNKQCCFRSNPFILIMFTCEYLCNVKSCEIKYV